MLRESPVRFFASLLFLALCSTALISRNAEAASSPPPKSEAARCSHTVRPTARKPFPNSVFMSMNGVSVGLLDSQASRTLIEHIAEPLGAFLGLKGIAGNIHVIFDTDYDAFSTSDGNVYVTLGVLQRAGSDQELMAIIAHELGHLRCGHSNTYSLTQAAKWAKLAGMVAFGAAGSRVGMIGSVQSADSSMKYAKAGRSRDNENEADLVAADAIIHMTGSYAGVLDYLGKIVNPDPTPEKESALTGADHPDAHQRTVFVREYARTLYPDEADPQPPSRTNLDAWQAADAPLVAALTRVESAAHLVGAPLTLFGVQHRLVSPAVDQKALALLKSAYAQFDSSGAAAAAGLAELKAMWLTRFVSAELEARRKLRLGQPANAEFDEIVSVMNDPQTPEWFLFYCGLLAAHGQAYGSAAKIMEIARKKYDDVSLTYSLYIAVLHLQEQEGEMHAAALFRLVTACGSALDKDLTSQCKFAMDNSAGFINALWQEFDRKLGALQ